MPVRRCIFGTVERTTRLGIWSSLSLLTSPWDLTLLAPLILFPVASGAAPLVSPSFRPASASSAYWNLVNFTLLAPSTFSDTATNFFLFEFNLGLPSLRRFVPADFAEWSCDSDLVWLYLVDSALEDLEFSKLSNVEVARNASKSNSPPRSYLDTFIAGYLILINAGLNKKWKIIIITTTAITTTIISTNLPVKHHAVPLLSFPSLCAVHALVVDELADQKHAAGTAAEFVAGFERQQNPPVEKPEVENCKSGQHSRFGSDRMWEFLSIQTQSG
ncbi:predicted protein [Sclerotinia sclerotiorum 1980 UF-70]|uniref:Uncharacterized protein n=1 Tax=Sclerotinia sclerotiorum (strain ATCC 18683 / 1980 / Ss-1) TaxID=665079 RepID=A7EQE1_SCLS1|nr:predicted protein [Sclerotinia sclerotiorum 1980 UF-70]EDN91683.1 predicted protein [Sclerotinia sclerotiorum 1980 UF-70]